MKKLTYYGATTLTLLSIGFLSNGYQADANQQTTVEVYHFNKSHHKYKISKAKNVKYSGKANLGKSIKYHGKNYYYLSKIKGYISLNDFNKINDHYAKQQKQKTTKTATDTFEDSKSTANSTASSAVSSAPEASNNMATNNNNSISNNIINAETLNIQDDGYDHINGRIINATNYSNTLQKAILDRINQYRSFKGLPPLVSNQSLDSIAYVRARYIARTGSLDKSSKHEDSDTGKLAFRLGLTSNADEPGMYEESLLNGIDEITDPNTLGKKIVDDHSSFSDEDFMYDHEITKMGIGVDINYIVKPEDGSGVVFLFS